jgi:hypothetical protein
VPRPAIHPTRITAGLTIDGHLDEASWLAADTTDGLFIQTTPEPGYPSAERTVIRMMYDESALYVGAVLYDAEPGNLKIPGLEQDYDTRSSDLFGVALDTYHDTQNGFIFAINPAGAVFDAQTFNDQRDVIPAWEGIVEVRTQIHDDRWVVELAIPFATLRFNPMEGDQTWGLNFSRRIRRLNEDANWAPLPSQFRLYKFTMAGTLEGLRDLPGGRNLWIKPSVLADRLEAVSGDADASADWGLDVKWGITPRLTMDLTANTDFSQVEVDREQVNLTRFSLFFPEKRDFFLENEGTFAFQDVAIRNFRTGSSPRSFKLFHSRRIGLSDGREPVPIFGGARLTGRVGERLEVGFLNMQTRGVDEVTGSPAAAAENFSVARVKTHLPGGNSVGVMFLNRQETGVGASPADYNRSFGVDGNFNLFQNLVVSTYLARTDEPSPMGDDQRIGMFQAAWRDALFDVSVLAKHVGDGFNPRMGFVDRRAVRRVFTTVGAHPQIQKGPLLRINPYLDYDAYSDLDGNLESRWISGGMNLVFYDGGMLTFELSDRFEGVFEPTSIAGIQVAEGEYDFREVTARYVASGSHVLSGILSVSHGGFYDGERTSVGASAVFRPNAHLRLDLGVQHNDLEMAGESFTADLFSAQIRYARDVRTFFMAFIQYNEATEELVTNARFNLIHAPLSDVFLVLTERRSLAHEVAQPVLERGVTLKVTRLLAF